MTRRRKNPRIVVLAIALLVGAIALIAREHRPSFLRPGLRLNAYVTSADGNISVIDLVRLRAVSRVPVGPALSGLREHPARPEAIRTRNPIHRIAATVPTYFEARFRLSVQGPPDPSSPWTCWKS